MLIATIIENDRVIVIVLREIIRRHTEQLALLPCRAGVIARMTTRRPRINNVVSSIHRKIRRHCL